MSGDLILQKHVKFLIRHLNVFPEQYCSLDTNRVTLLFFAISALDLLGELNRLLTEERRKSIIDWIYKLQITSRRPPGSFRADMDSNVLHGVNFLAAARRSTEVVTLWAVSEEHNGHSIQESTVQVRGDATLSEGKLMSEVKIDDPVMELRLCEMNNNQVWTRCKRHLSLVEPSTAANTRVFRGSVRSFEECKVLPGDLALCDMAGMVWSGTVGTSLSRTKTISADAKLITYSDHPRVVFVSSAHEVKNLDLRVGKASTALELFTVPEFAKKGPTDKAVYIPEEPQERPHICHLKALPSHPHNFYVMTAHSAYLCDDRFPKNAVLTLPHTIPYGAHVLQASDPVPDPEGTGDVVSLYFLDHLLTGIWVSRLYRHSCEVWSSILPIHQLEDTTAIEKLVKPALNRTYRRSLQCPAMGMAVVQGFKDNLGRPAELLLRALSNGSVWYQTMRYGKMEQAELKNLWSASQKRAEVSLERAGKSELFTQPLPGRMRRPTESLCTTVNLEEVEECVSEVSKKPWRPMQKKVYKKCQPLELLPSSGEAVLPRVINEVWKKAMGMSDMPQV
ncbi:hypothetical protein Aduo_003961 [Ancylostoma duodenale]